jgi:2-dehydropantoate 2-reductase
VSPRVQKVSALLQMAGFRSRILDDVRSETWLKAWGNLAFNPISALTGATLEDLCRFEPTRELAARMMREAQQVAEALGATFRVGIEQRIAGAEAVGPHKTSMLQDLERGSRLETDALVGAVLELADMQGIQTPSIRAVYAAVRLLEQTRARGEPPEYRAAGSVDSLAQASRSMVVPPAIAR